MPGLASTRRAVAVPGRSPASVRRLVRGRWWLVAAMGALLTVLAAGPASPGSSADARTLDRVEHGVAEKAGTTTVTLVLENCPECTVRPVRYVPSQGPKARDWPIRKVGPDGKVSYDVPTRLTPGMAFFIEAPWHGSDGSAALLAVRYAGTQAGTRVTSRMARTGHRASPCWAGTTEATATIPVRVDRFRTRTYDLHRTWHPRAFASHALESTPPMMGPLWKGSLGAQDFPQCDVPVDEGPSTTVTYAVPDCEGCLVRVYQYPAGSSDPPYISDEKMVSGGEVRFVVPTRRTAGLEVSVRALRDGLPVGIAMAVARYQDYQPGDAVTLDQAHAQTVGSTCWAGTDTPEVTLSLAVRQEEVYTSAQGLHQGTVAWLSPQLDSLEPMGEVLNGLYVTEELPRCEVP